MHLHRTFRQALATLATVLAVGGGAGLAAALPAGATTLTCTNIANATNPPFGCGGLQSASTAHGQLDLAHLTDVYNSLVVVAPDASSVTEDWTAFKVDGLTGAGGLGVYVAMATRDGNLPTFTVTSAPLGSTCTIGGNAVTRLVGQTYTNTDPCPGEGFTAGPNDLCISVENAAHVPGTNGKLRWWSVLRTCSTNGTFTYGAPRTGEAIAGVAGTVTAGFANQWQAWAPVISSNGYVLVNTWLFNHQNVNFVLDITGGGGAGTPVQAYPENDAAITGAVSWEQWGLIGCTPPASNLGGVTSPPYVNCP